MPHFVATDMNGLFTKFVKKRLQHEYSKQRGAGGPEGGNCYLNNVKKKLQNWQGWHLLLRKGVTLRPLRAK